MLNVKGKEKYFDVIFSPINSKDKTGKCIIATIRNITELKTRENELREQKAYFEQLFNGVCQESCRIYLKISLNTASAETHLRALLVEIFFYFSSIHWI
ncbi:MAG: hypothetical protein ACOCXL_01250 [Halanaerobium sp.]